VANWRKTSAPNVYVAHQQRCAAFRDENIDRLEWPELLDGQRIASRLLVTREERGGSRAASTQRSHCNRLVAVDV
jgi:hypothetical protein